MTHDDIIRMAREAGAATGRHSPHQKKESIMPLCMDVERFAALVAAAEREACAELCDDLADLWDDDGHPGKAAGARMCASDIREINK